MQSLLCHASVRVVASLIPRPGARTEREIGIVRAVGGVDL